MLNITSLCTYELIWFQKEFRHEEELHSSVIISKKLKDGNSLKYLLS